MTLVRTAEAERETCRCVRKPKFQRLRVSALDDAEIPILDACYRARSGGGRRRAWRRRASIEGVERAFAAENDHSRLRVLPLHEVEDDAYDYLIWIDRRAFRWTPKLAAVTYELVRRRRGAVGGCRGRAAEAHGIVRRGKRPIDRPKGAGEFLRRCRDGAAHGVCTRVSKEQQQDRSRHPNRNTPRAELEDPHDQPCRMFDRTPSHGHGT